MVRYSRYVICPSLLSLTDCGRDDGEMYLLYDLFIRDFGLPTDVEKAFMAFKKTDFFDIRAFCGFPVFFP